MKSRRDKEHFFRLPPPKNAKLKEGTLFAPLSKSVGKISLNCDYCDLLYETYAAWAKRYSKHFCSNACRAAYLVKIKERVCPSCGAKFLVKAGGPFTCSDTCEEKALVERVARAYTLADLRWKKSRTDTA